MRKTLYCGVDPHSNNAMYVITDEQDQQLLRQRLPNELPLVLQTLAPYRARLKVVAVESTYNWYWLVDGLVAKDYPVVLAHPSEMEQYSGRFATGGDYTSYCRCVRATHSSNGKKKAHNNAKNGNPYLAWAFVEAVHHALRTCAPAKAFYDRKRAKRNGALATKALAAQWSKAAYYIMQRQEAVDLTQVFG